jgi:formylglycine-generating enzyme required for sulfatase activity
VKFQQEFVTIPEGKLPYVNGYPKMFIKSFEAARYPVTRELWNEIMGDIPPRVPRDEIPTWNQCPTCPVTYVRFEDEDFSPSEIQVFLRRLNQKTQGLGCTYELPTINQLHYMIRADVTGENTDKYSLGVTDANVDEYVTHIGNSNRKIQPVGVKTPNAFKIELGNVSSISRSPDFDSDNQLWGRKAIGGSYSTLLTQAQSDHRSGVMAGDPRSDSGFSLVRKCN